MSGDVVRRCTAWLIEILALALQRHSRKAEGKEKIFVFLFDVECCYGVLSDTFFSQLHYERKREGVIMYLCSSHFVCLGL